MTLITKLFEKYWMIFWSKCIQKTKHVTWYFMVASFGAFQCRASCSLAASTYKTSFDILRSYPSLSHRSKSSYYTNEQSKFTAIMPERNSHYSLKLSELAQALCSAFQPQKCKFSKESSFYYFDMIYHTKYLVDVAFGGGGMTWVGGLCARYIALTARLPSASITFFCSGSNASMTRDLTFETCTPKLRWIPQHSMQSNTWNHLEDWKA